MGKPRSHVLRVTEVNIAVKDTEAALRDVGEVLGLDADPIITDPTPPVQARLATFQLPAETRLGVMASTEPASPIDRFIHRRGEGIFSISLEVDDIAATMADWQARGIQFVLSEPIVRENARIGGRHWREVRLNFTRPNPKLHGIVLEIQELHGGN